MGIIVTIGGYESESQKDQTINTPIEIDKKILSLTGKKKPKVLFVPTASKDSTGYINSITKIYEGQLSASMKSLLLHGEKLTTKEIQELIDWADVIYVGGGNTLMMMKKWRRLGVDKMLKRAHKEGTVLCGVSAGSICWFDYGVSDSLHFYDDKTMKYIKVAGLGILPGVHCPHFGSKLYDKGFRTAGMKEIMKRSKGKCTAIPDGGALVHENGKVSSIGEASSLAWWEEGEWLTL
ncbi:MAG: dipeptidase E [Oceanicoccus sp.]|jgi:dipeptidase E